MQKYAVFRLLFVFIEVKVTFSGNKYIQVFCAFDQVVSACFGKELKSDYKEHIKKFFYCVKKLCITVTPKVHALIYHVPEFIEMTGHPLGFYSEQASESVHYAYTNHAEDFKINKNHSNYHGKLLRSVCSFNALRQ